MNDRHARTCLLLAAIVLLLPCCRGGGRGKGPGSAPEVVLFRDATTAEGETAGLHLHVFKPAEWQAQDRRPAAVFFFGGGWRKGSPKQFFAHCSELAARGMVAASAEYRVSSRHGTKATACVEDGKAAVRYLREHAAELGIDPNRIVAAGGSAGGHVAACTALVDGFDPDLEASATSCVPQWLVLFNPVLDTSLASASQAKRFGADPVDLSPLHHVYGGQPPILVLHGTEDRTVPIESARAFTARSTAAGARCTLVEFEGAGHGFFNTSDLSRKGRSRRAMDAVIRFLEDEGLLEDSGI